MTDRVDGRVAALVVVLAATVLVVSAAAPVLTDARPAREIPAPTVDGDLAEPDADAWSEVSAADVPLSAAPSGVPNYEQVSVREVTVQAARSDGRLYVRVRWTDETANADVDGPRSFADGAAVQIPVDTSTQPAIAMGSTDNRVNVWFWRADNETEELLAGGQGSTTEFEESDLEVTATHEDEEWTVVFSRSLDASATNRTAITDDADLDVAFAAWDGENMERSGHKAASNWYYFPLGTGDEGAPFETLLWALAGIAIAAVVVVTALAVRRTRESSGGGDA
ncbi:MAG: ethylbenzene dehydrogenase-related protein [Halobacteriales archaeon]